MCVLLCRFYIREKYQADMKPFSDHGTARFVSGGHDCFLHKPDRLSWSEVDTSDNELTVVVFVHYGTKNTFIS